MTKQNSSVPPANTLRRIFPVTGMSCAACAVTVENTVGEQPGVVDAAVNYANQSLQVEYDPARLTPAEMQKAVQAAGYDLIVADDRAEADAAAAEAKLAAWQTLRTRTIGATLLTVPVFILGMFFMDRPYVNWIMLALSTPVVGWFGRQFFRNAWKQARHGKANMDSLVAISTGVAYSFSAFNTFYPDYFQRHGLHGPVYFEAAAVVITFILLGKLLEARAKSHTSDAIRKLMDLQPKTVRLIRSGLEIEAPAAEVQPGDRILVRPGDKIAIDGTVASGQSYVDESMISGEPVPVLKSAGARVYAGALNQQGSFEFLAEKVGAQTFLSQMIRLVQEAQGSKAPVQRLVDRIAGIFVPVVLGIALLTFAVWMFAGGTDALAHALMTGISVLVIACPCALGLATPTALMVGIGKGASQGILIKDAEGLEIARRVDTVVLDKTGTITEGKPGVVSVYWFAGEDKSGILLSIEKRSEHPLATAIVRWLEQKSVREMPVTNFENRPGRGVKAESEGIPYWAGNAGMLEEEGLSLPSDNDQVSADQTIVYFGAAGQVIARLAIADPVKSTSAAAVASLDRMGIGVYLYSGDQPTAVCAVAEAVGITFFQGNMLPVAKAEGIKSLQKSGKIVAMAGDGINDAPALAQADLSIAMGRGSDIAMDVAHITLLHSDLSMVSKAITLSRRTVATIRQNLFWAFCYNLIGIPLAAGVLYPVNGFLLNPMIAGAAMALSSVSVVGNSLCLKYQSI